MNTTVRKQGQTAVAAMAAKLTDEALCLAWMATEGKPITQELALVRGWMMDELNERLGDELFDEWLMDVDDSGNGVSPLAYFAIAR
jgi:NTP pyrophosphatase (non-canonical NTP hydrolase)